MWQPILMINGYIISILGLSMLAPAAYDRYIAKNGDTAFISAAIITTFIGMGLFLSNRGKINKISLRQGYLITLLSWFMCGMFATLPVMLDGSISGFSNAVFEVFSGISGTGATIVTDIESLPRSMLLWRSMLNALGGIGIVIFAVALLPFLGIGGMQIFQRENSDFDNKFMPKFSYIAKRIIFVFIALTTMCCLALKFGGMGWFDAINHAFTSVATGGFSTKNDSIGAFNSFKIEMILSLFMLAGALPMTFYITLWQNKELKSFRTPQVLFFLKVVMFIIAMMAFWLVYSGRYEFLDALRYAIFNVISVITTTGYSSADYVQWGSFAVMLFFLISFCGGCTGSTTGSIKMFRWEILLAYMKRNFVSASEPKRVLPVKIDEKPVNEGVIASVYIYLSAFFSTAVIGMLLVSASGVEPWTAFAAVVACITNVGPAVVEQIGPSGSFASFSPFVKYVLSLMMMMGRLEIITVLVIFTKSFWQKS